MLKQLIGSSLAILYMTGVVVAQQKPVGTIVVAHGAGPEWNAEVAKVAKLAQTGGPVEVAFLMGPGAKARPFQQVVAELAPKVSRIVVVPLLVSSYSGHYEQIRYLAGETNELSETMMHHLHMGGLKRAESTVPLHVARAIDDSGEIAQILTERALALAKEPARQALFIVGHGPNSADDLARWMQNLRVVADTVAARTRFRDVKLGLVQDDAPPHVRGEAVQRVREIIELQHELTGRAVLVVPVLISRGRLSHERLPRDLAGLPIVYTGEPLLPHAGIARWIEARVKEVSATTAAK
ncbi:MAG: sirohydrochlorin chelatase [Gemmatimonadota bacterium]